MDKNMGTQSGQRVALWDNIKFILIVLVVVGHFCDAVIDSPGFKSVYIFIYAFHMPLFIFIAGIFHRDHKIAQKITTYLICGFSLQIFIFELRLLIDGDTKYSIFNMEGVCWYMFAMAAFIAVTYGVRNLNKKLIFVFSLVFCCYACYDNQMGDLLSWGRIVEFYPFYLLGNIVDPEVFLKLKKRKGTSLVGGSLLIAWGSVCALAVDWIYRYRRIFTGHVPYNSIEYRTGIGVKALCLLISAVMCLAVILLVPDRRIPLMTVWGSRTLQVYLWHYPVLTVLADACGLGAVCGTAAGRWGYVLIAVLTACVLSTPVFGFFTDYIQKHLPKSQTGGKPIPSESESSRQKEGCQ